MLNTFRKAHRQSSTAVKAQNRSWEFVIETSRKLKVCFAKVLKSFDCIFDTFDGRIANNQLNWFGNYLSTLSTNQVKPAFSIVLNVSLSPWPPSVR